MWSGCKVISDHILQLSTEMTKTVLEHQFTAQISRHLIMMEPYINVYNKVPLTSSPEYK